MCGRRYCLVTELTKASAQGRQGSSPLSPKSGKASNANGTLVTTHCFLTEQAPTKGRLWYVVTSHSLQWKQPGQPSQDILVVKNHSISLAPGARQWLGDLADAFRADRSPVGRRLFYLRQTKWGFTLGAPPSAPDPVTLQMALLAATASALTPDPPGADPATWIDRRLLLLPERAPERLWQRTTKPGSKLLRWTIRGKTGKKSRSKGKASTGRSGVSVRGLAQVLDGHLDKVRLDWSSDSAGGRLLLISKGLGCLDSDLQIRSQSPNEGRRP